MYRTSPKHVHLLWKDARTDAPLQTLPAARDALKRSGVHRSVLINAGIYEPGYIPTGLHIEHGQTLVALNTASGKGNFFIKPNGVFRIARSKASIHPTTTEANDTLPPPQLAVQSGPLLVHNTTISTSLRPTFTSRKHRNAVCVHPNGDVLFLISQPAAPAPTLYTLAEAVLDLGCTSGLYLDGTISCALDPDDSELPECARSRSFAAIFALYTPAQKRSRKGDP